MRLRVEDAGVLARVAQYEKLPEEHFAEALAGCNEDARLVAERMYLIRFGTSPQEDEYTRVARRLLLWAERNRNRRAYEGRP